MIKPNTITNNNPIGPTTSTQVGIEYKNMNLAIIEHNNINNPTVKPTPTIIFQTINISLMLKMTLLI